jgi:hypothetical protein
MSTDFKSEAAVVERYYDHLQDIEWRGRERKIEWCECQGCRWCDPDGMEKWPARATFYEIVQISTLTTKGHRVILKTMFTRNQQLHRVSGPAYQDYEVSHWYVNGREYTENEFNFFIKGMML